jgi:acyl-coenzyme A synthetase/AMP-(fatty) acid ligase
MPRELEFRTVLPKTPVGKLSRNELRKEELAKSAGSPPNRQENLP